MRYSIPATKEELNVLLTHFRYKVDISLAIGCTKGTCINWWATESVSKPGLQKLAIYFNKLGNVSPEIRAFIESKLGQTLESIDIKNTVYARGPIGANQPKNLQEYDLMELVEAIELKGWTVDLTRNKVA